MMQNPVDVISQSRFFDAEWYVQTYPDVQTYPGSPAHHFVICGAPLGRDPGPAFSTKGYFHRYPLVAADGHNALWHFEHFGHDGAYVPTPSTAGVDHDLLASRVDRSTAPPPDADALLSQVFAARPKGTPDRLLYQFDHSAARTFIRALTADQVAETTARNTLVSAVMPTHNRASTLARAVRSVLAQSHHHLELIVVDDGSTDDTAHVMQAFNTDPRLTFVQVPHSGVSAARNAGLARAKGDFIAYLDSDNIWTPDYLRLILTALISSGADCGYAASRLHCHQGEIMGYRGEPFDWAYSVDANYVDLNVFCHSAGMVKKHGHFDPQLRRMVDWDLILRYTKDHHPIYCPFLGCLYSDDTTDNSRISTSKPYVFEKIVSDKHAFGHRSVHDTLDNMILSIAIKVRDMPDAPLPLAQALQALGHTAQIDAQDDWTTRHPHEDQVVMVMPEAGDFVPHPEQITLYAADFMPERTADEAAAAIMAEVRRSLIAGEKP